MAVFLFVSGGIAFRLQNQLSNFSIRSGSGSPNRSHDTIVEFGMCFDL